MALWCAGDGQFFSAFLDASRLNVVDVASGGRSSRTFQTEGFWDTTLQSIKPGDIVLIQLGQNDVFPVNDDSRARGTLPGTGPGTQEIDNLVTHKHEIVHTYGWYMRKYVRDTIAKSATPIVMSLTPRNASAKRALAPMAEESLGQRYQHSKAVIGTH